MSFRHVILFLMVPALYAQEPRSARQIESALQDELYTLAEEQLWEALSVKTEPEEESDLTILLIRALAGQGALKDAVILSDESSHLPKQDAFIYWRARILFDANQLAEAAQCAEFVPEDSVYAAAALRLKGRAEQELGDVSAAIRTYETFRKRFPTDENAPQNLLDLAAIYLERKQRSDVIQVCRELLMNFPNHEWAAATRLELAHQLMGTDDSQDQREAIMLLTALGTDESAPSRLRAAAWVDLSTLQQRTGHIAESADALAKAETLTADMVQKVRQKAVLAGLRIDEGKTKEAFALLDDAVKESPDTAITVDLFLQKAEALLKTGDMAAAEKAFQTCLDLSADPAIQIRAQSGKGWSLWEQKRYEEAAIAFETAGFKGTQPDFCVTVLIKAGDARLAAGQYERAVEAYRRVIEKYPDHAMTAQAVYQWGVAQQFNGKLEGARSAFEQVEKQFPNSEFAPLAAFQAAELFKQEKKWELAIEQYHRIDSQYTNDAIRATALQQQGLLLYATEQWAEAQEHFQAVSTNFPESIEAPQALYMRGFCREKLGDSDGALALCLLFIDQYPDSQWAPEVLFWIGERYYNRGNYAQAQIPFLDIATRFPASDLLDDALFWAANALLKQDQFLEAFTVLGRIAKEVPGSPLMMKTRFAQGETLTELGEFPRAILAYEEVIKTNPDAPLADQARGRLADCLFTLGTSEPGRYQEALAAYQTLYKRSTTPFALRLQAKYKIARCEAKLGRKEKAFAHYLEAVYSGAEHTELLSPEAVPWFTRAAFDAAAYQEQQQQWKEAVNIYERVVQSGVPAKQEAQKRIEKIKRDHVLSF
ncbi:MAG: tetratricopeptide repeat protein [Kiritimatiellaceae bacterium]|nr:tetratricopeptide repeat protein [Kiritimatiellaceae bacterium]